MNLKENYKKLFKGKPGSNDKGLLKEACAWERTPGKPLPTLKDVTEKHNEAPVLKEGIENKIPGMKDFLLFKSIMDTRTIKRADEEDQRRWAEVTEELDDVLTNWMDLLVELDKIYPS